MLILNDGKSNSFEAAIRLLDKSHSLQIACSYLQPRGWEIIRAIFSESVLKRSKLVFTDQLSITNPAAVQMAMRDGVATHVFRGDVTYHPKCYISLNSQGVPEQYVIGSANVSASALRTGIEVGLAGSEPAHLNGLHAWFNDIFEHHSDLVTAPMLGRMEEKWKLAAAARAKSRLKVVVAKGSAKLTASPAELAETYEDAFDAIKDPLGMLNFDHAANNVRTLDRARLVLSEWPSVDGKAASEMKLLGFVTDGQLTSLGESALKTTTPEELALVWCQWLLETPEEDLRAINVRLLAARRALLRFSQLRPEVSDFFIANVNEKSERKLLQTIELVCSASGMVEELGLDEIRVLSALLPLSENMAAGPAAIIREYFQNKGARGWELQDRKIVVQAFRKAVASS